MMQSLHHDTLDHIRILVKGSADVTVSFLKTALESHPHVAEAVNERDLSGNSLLQYAVIANRIDLVEYLITQGADLNPPTCGRPLHLAARLGHRALIKVLLHYGADTDVQSCVCYPNPHQSGKTLFGSKHWYFSCIGDVLSSKEDNVVFDYPLYFAIKADSVSSVQELLAHGATKLALGRSCLQAGCLHGSVKCARLFLKQNPSSALAPDVHGLCPIQRAAKWSKDLVEMLVLHGASVNVRTPQKLTLPHIAAQDCHATDNLYHIIKYLLQCGFNKQLNAMDVMGRSVLHYLVSRVFSGGGTVVPTHGVSHCDSTGHAYLASHRDGNNQLQDVLSRDQLQVFETVQLLVSAGANPCLQDQNGSTPIDALLMNGSLHVTSAPARHLRSNYRLLYHVLLLMSSPNAGRRHTLVLKAQSLAQLVERGCAALLLVPQTPEHGGLVHFTKALTLISATLTESKWETSEQCLIHSALGCLENIPSGVEVEMDEGELASRCYSVVIGTLTAILEGGYPVKACSPTRSCPETALDALLKYSYAIEHFEMYVDGLLLLLHHGAEVCPVARPAAGCGPAPRLAGWATACADLTPVRDIVQLLHRCPCTAAQSHLRRALDILYNATGERSFRRAIGGLRHLGESHCALCETLVAEMWASVKSLRQSCASVVFIHVCQRRKANVERLLVPAALKTYLLSLQY